ncbi:MAG: hypothetical protein DDT34_00218 [Firmicutes bacterium]|nr:hypothetical protein [Bacillota bacterium]
MSAQIEVPTGPFAGKTLRGNLTPSSFNDITTIATVDAVQATQVFLETFNPTEGWSVQVTGEVMALNMIPLPNEAGVTEHCPTALFKASLLKDGNVVNTASTLWVLSRPTEWEKGETNARLRLYQALGLPVRQDIGMIEPIAGKPRPTLTAVPSPYKDRDQAVSAPKEASQAAQSEQVEPTKPMIESTEEAAPSITVETQAATPMDVQAEPLVLSNPTPVASGEQPNKALIENIRRVCNMRGQAMPALNTKADAEEFLKKLLNKGA